MVYAIVDIATSTVTNAIEWDGVSPFHPPAGHVVIPMPEGAWIGSVVELPP